MGFKSGTSDLDQLTVSGDTAITGSLEISGSITIVGAEAGAATLTLKADQGDDAADTTTLSTADGGVFTIASAGTSAITINASGQVTKIGQDSPSNNHVLTWDNSNGYAVWAAVSGGGTADSVAADDIDTADGNIAIAGGSGHSITLNATAAQAQLKTTTSGQVDITSAADIDINATTGIAIDATTVSIDGTDDSNLTVTASGKDLDIAVAGGSTQELRLASAGTGASALHLNASAGSVDIDSADAITVDAADEIVVTTTSADGHISLVSAHTAGVAFHIDANAHADSEVQIDAGILDIDVTAGTTLNTTSLTITDTTTSSATEGGAIRLVSDDGAAMADDHRLGVIEFAGAEDASNTITVGAKIEAICDAGWSASENGAALVFSTTDANATQSEVLRLDSNKLATFAGGFAVGSDAEGDMLYHNGTKYVRLARGSDNHVLTMDGNVPNWEAASGGSSAADDISTGDAAVNIVTTSGNITLDAQADDADIIFKVDDNGSAVTALTLDGSDEGNAIFVNDLKLQSDSAAIHFGANDDIVLTHEADRGLILTQATETTAEPVFTIKNTGDLASGGGIEFISDNGAGEGDDDVLGYLSFKGDDSGDAATQYAKISVLASDVTNNDEAGEIRFEVMLGGTAASGSLANVLSLGGEDTANSSVCEVVVNEGQNDVDFRVESNYYENLLFCDAGSGNVGVMNANPVTSLDVVNDFATSTFENKIGTTLVGGGNKLLYSPGANDTLTKGQIYYLHTDGTWNLADADDVDSGASQLLGVALGDGSSQVYPMILEGFVRVPSGEIENTPGSGAVDGLPVYVSTEAGSFDFTAPSGQDDYVRVVGYAIDDHSGDVLVYFKPDPTWVVVT